MLLSLAHGNTTVSEIARETDYARQSIQRLADMLVAHGLAIYAPDSPDRRIQVITLTADGSSLPAEMDADFQRWSTWLVQLHRRPGTRKFASVRMHGATMQMNLRVQLFRVLPVRGSGINFDVDQPTVPIGGVMPADTRTRTITAAPIESLQLDLDAAARRMYDAEGALHLARQAHIDEWITLAYDLLHQTITEHGLCKRRFAAARCA